MTTKELINQYVTAHADNRWMDASELEALLTEFAEKLKEPASEDLEQAANDLSMIYAGEGCVNPKREKFAFYIGFKNGAQWQLNKIKKENEKNRD